MRNLEQAFQDIAETIDFSREKNDIPAVLKGICDRYDLKTVAYFGLNINRIAEDDPYLAVTYSEEWVEHYKRQNYLLIDPVISVGFTSILPVEWGSFSIRGQKLRKFFGEAAEFGLGRNG